MPELGSVLSRAKWAANTLRTFSMEPEGRARGRVLLSYVHLGLRAATRGETPGVRHPSHAETVTMARTWRDLGFGVDVISFHNRIFRPRKRYDVVIDTRWNLERWAPDLPASTVKVFHADSSHNLQKTAAEHERLLDLQRRRGVSLAPRLGEPFNRGAETADTISVIGNDVTAATFAHAGVPMHQLDVTTATTYGWDEDKDHDRARRRFLWLGSRGAVAKGLDRLLEVFARNPDLHLTVCGPVSDEHDVMQAFARELRGLPNIDLRGWIDVTSPAFVELCRRTSALVYPSATEGQSGAAATAMQAGLIPVCSRETGLDVPPERGILLGSSSLDEIETAVRDLAGRPAGHLAALSRAAWEHARAHHTLAAFARDYRHVAERILEGGAA